MEIKLCDALCFGESWCKMQEFTIPEKGNQRGDFIGMQYLFLFWSALSTLPIHRIFVVSYNTGWCIHTFFCAVFLSLLNSIVTLFNKFDYPCQLRAIKSIKPSFIEVPYASYYSPRYLPHQHYDTVLFDHKSLLARQLKFKTFLNIATHDHVQLQ